MWSSTILSDSRTATRVSRGPTFTKISFRIQNSFWVRAQSSAHAVLEDGVGGARHREKCWDQSDPGQGVANARVSVFGQRIPPRTLNPRGGNLEARSDSTDVGGRDGP